MKANRWHAMVVLVGLAGCGEIVGVEDAPLFVQDMASYRLETFQALDRNGDGRLTVDEFVPTTEELIAQTQSAGRKVSLSRIERERQSYFNTFAALDRNGDGFLEFAEFGD